MDSTGQDSTRHDCAGLDMTVVWTGQDRTGQTRTGAWQDSTPFILVHPRSTPPRLHDCCHSQMMFLPGLAEPVDSKKISMYGY